MKTIATASIKGGVGKSTITCGVAAILSMFAPRQRTLVVDAGGQPNTLLYLEGCGPDQLPNIDTAATSDPDTLAGLHSWQSGHAFRLIDLPGYGDARELRGALQTVAGQDHGVDLVVVPTAPYQFDIEAVVPWVQDSLVPLGIPYGVVLNKTGPTAANESINVQRQLHAEGINTFHAFVRDYRAWRDAQSTRKPITLFGPKHGTARNAEDDMRALTREVLQRLGSRIHIPTRWDQTQAARQQQEGGPGGTR